MQIFYIKLWWVYHYHDLLPLDQPRQDGNGFFHGIPENFPSLSDLVGEFSEQKQTSTDRKAIHMVNYQRNDDGTITAKLEERKHYY